MRIEEKIDVILFSPSKKAKEGWADFGCEESVFTKLCESIALGFDDKYN